MVNKLKGTLEGVRQRVNAFAERQRQAGMQARKIWATDTEAARLRAILSAWRGKPAGLSDGENQAAEVLKPSFCQGRKAI